METFPEQNLWRSPSLTLCTPFLPHLTTASSLSVNDSSSSAGRKNSLAPQGTKFSTKDMDNDNCMCKCAQMLSGGWWFDACGLSNLNGIYYSVHQHLHKINGIRWHYFRGPSYSLHGTRMMLRPMGA